MEFNNVDEIYEYINTEKLPRVLDRVGNFVSDQLNETIEDELYHGDFEPNFYQRRYKNGGYGDRNNIHINYIKPGLIEVVNESLANGDENGNRLDSIIEYGEEYGWNRQPPPRPVFEITKDKLELGDLMSEVVIKELGNLGLESE
ncbi:MAG: hypothetical protein RR909_04120 [Bacilli bacterium]